MTKFKTESPIYYHRLEIYQSPTKYSFQTDQYKVEEKEVVVENDKYIVFNDAAFTKIAKSGDGFVWGVLNKEVVSFRDCLGAKGIFYTLYTNRKVRPSTIERHIREKANKEYGYLFSNKLDLSILKSEA